MNINLYSRMWLASVVALAISVTVAYSQEATAPATKQDNPNTAELYSKFSDQLSGSILVGSFTTITDADGKQQDSELTEERYEIRAVKKMEKGDYWIITTRIQYGERDMTIPVPVEVKWAGTTPVITLDKVTLPGLGTFGARVVIHDGKYAGTWSHDKVGGHLFGRIEATKDKDTGKDTSNVTDNETK